MKYHKKQMGLSLIELMIALTLTIPFIIFMQNQIMDIIDLYVQKNILNSLKMATTALSNAYSDNGECSTDNEYKLIDRLPNSISSFEAKHINFSFFIKYSCPYFSVLGVYTPPKSIHISNETAYDILGANGGYLSGENIVSFTHSFKSIPVKDIQNKKGPFFAYLILAEKLNANEEEIKGDVYFNGTNYHADGIYDICFDRSVNNYMTLTWKPGKNYEPQEGRFNLLLKFENEENPLIINESNLLLNGIYYAPVSDFFKYSTDTKKELQAGDVFGLELQLLSKPKKIKISFPQFRFCQNKYGV
ncbi:hypothetical protein QUQ58_004720 [Escherichia coli]|nr:hypothetical protein [Escherichia coli]